MTFTHHYNSPLGLITMASDGENLTGLWFDGQKYFGSTLDSAQKPQNSRSLHRQNNGLRFISAEKSPGLPRPCP